MTHTIRHPWTTIHLKRKSPDSADIVDSNTLKRLKSNTLEHGFAHLNLDKPLDYEPTSHSSAPEVEIDMLDEAASSAEDVSDILIPADETTLHLPTSAEEPPKKAPWYEPEKDRIVITDLDAVESDEESIERPFEISPILLRRLAARPPPPPLPKKQDDMALILFKPLPTIIPQQERVEEKRERDEDAMMMDVE